VSILDDLNPFNPKSPLYLLPGPSLTPQQQKQGPSLAPGPNNLALTQQQQQSGSHAISSVAGALGLSGIEELAVRILETLVGVALILLGLQALTGQGSGNPITATRRVVRKVA
jgi:hypothetical protein